MDFQLFQLKKWVVINSKLTRRYIIIYPGIQKVITETSNIPMEKLNDEDREIIIDI